MTTELQFQRICQLLLKPAKKQSFLEFLSLTNLVSSSGCAQSHRIRDGDGEAKAEDWSEVRE